MLTRVLPEVVIGDGEVVSNGDPRDEPCIPIYPFDPKLFKLLTQICLSIN